MLLSYIVSFIHTSSKQTKKSLNIMQSDDNLLLAVTNPIQKDFLSFEKEFRLQILMLKVWRL